MPYRHPYALARFLGRLMSRSILSPEEQDAILHLPVSVRQVATKRDIVHPGEQVDHACLVAEGLVGRFGQLRDGSRQITALHIPGDMPDLHSVALPLATSALQALTATTILKVPHDAIRALATRYPALAEAFWRDCVVDAAIGSRWIEVNGRRDAKARLAHLLCEMALRYAEIRPQQPGAFHFPITQEHLADATSLTPVHVNRVLRLFKASAIVTVRRAEVEICDLAGLMKIAGFDPAYLHIGGSPTRLAAPPPDSAAQPQGEVRGPL